MKPNIIHSILQCLAAFALPFVVSCSSQDAPLPDTTEATLYLNVATMGQTRAGLGELSNNEKMRSLRVIILHSDGTVEHNRHYSLEGSQENKYIILKVKPNEEKEIFLFANEESVTDVEGVTAEGLTGEKTSLTAFFESYADGKNGFSDAVNSLYFVPDYSDGKPIPMSSTYKVDIPDNRNIEKTFYVVRVATRFTVNFTNWRDEEVKVRNFTMASHADKNFLMAHVNDSEQNRKLFNGKTWMDWLKDASYASSKNDSYAATEAAGWLKDYELPSTADLTNTYEHGEISVDAWNPGSSMPGKQQAVFYLPESKNLKTGATDGEQEYTMTIDIDGRQEPFTFQLPNLKALFRNTHVVVNITIAMNNRLEITVEVEPWENRELYLDYTETVISDGAISWEEETYDEFDNENRIIVLKPWKYSKNDFDEDMVWVPLTGSFTFTNPIGAKWTASILTTEGTPVFRFLTPQGEAVPNMSGTIGGYYDDKGNYHYYISDLFIVSLESEPQHKNSAKLQIVVTLPNGTVLSSGFGEYTIVQNPL